MSSVKGTSAYWKQDFDVLAMVKQFHGIVRWEELSCIIKELNNLGLTDKEPKKLSYQIWFNLINKNPGPIFSIKFKYF